MVIDVLHLSDHINIWVEAVVSIIQELLKKFPVLYLHFVQLMKLSLSARAAYFARLHAKTGEAGRNHLVGTSTARERRSWSVRVTHINTAYAVSRHLR